MSLPRVSTAVALLAKAPVPGKVKTRFCPPCTPEEAAGFAKAFLCDTAAMLAAPCIATQVDLWCSYLGDTNQLKEIFGQNLLAQRGENLGERIANATEDLFDLGYRRVVVLCADCPTVNAAYFQDTLTALDAHDVVFGPARDGGCVLVGLGNRAPFVFRDVEMSTDHVLTDMQRLVSATELTTLMLPPRYDLDTMDDLLSALSTGELAQAKNTLELLANSPFASNVAFM